MRISAFASVALLRAWSCAYVGIPAQASALLASAAFAVDVSAHEDASAAVDDTDLRVSADGAARAGDGNGFVSAVSGARHFDPTRS